MTNAPSAALSGTHDLNECNRRRNYERAQDIFNAMHMARDYLQRYTDVLNGRALHKQAPVVSAAATQLPWVG